MIIIPPGRKPAGKPAWRSEFVRSAGEAGGLVDQLGGKILIPLANGDGKAVSGLLPQS